MLLELIADSGGQAALTELAERAGLNISTCHHLLATLIQRGFVTKIQGRRYALGARSLPTTDSRLTRKTRNWRSLWQSWNASRSRATMT